MKRVLVSAVAVLALSGIGYGGGDYVPVAPVAVDSWSGCYVGAQVGANFGNSDVDLYGAVGNKITEFDLDPNGLNAGIYAGCNWLMENNFLVGIEGDWSYVDADDSAEKSMTLWPNVDKVGYRVEQDWDASLRVRLGKVIDDTYLPYITGGMAWAKVKGTMIVHDLLLGNLHDTDTATMSGWTLGAGIEMKIDENFHVRLQYRYTDYGNDTFHHTINGNDFDAKVNYNTHMIQLGVSYHF